MRLSFPNRTGATGAAGRTARTAPRVPFALLVGGLIVGSLVLLLVLNTASAANELERHGLAAKNADVAAKLQDLHERAARSAAPENLARAAGDLGMVPAGNPAFVVIGADGAARVLGKPKQATAAPVVVPKKPKQSTTAPATPSTTLPVTAPPTGTAAPGATPTRPTPTRPTPTGTPTRTAPTTPTTPRPTSTPTPEITLPGGVR